MAQQLGDDAALLPEAAGLQALAGRRGGRQRAPGCLLPPRRRTLGFQGPAGGCLQRWRVGRFLPVAEKEGDDALLAKAGQVWARRGAHLRWGLLTADA